MTAIQVTDSAAEAISDMREDTYGVATIEKGNLITEFSDCARFAALAKEEDDLQPWVDAIENIQTVLSDYWRIRRFVEDTHD